MPPECSGPGTCDYDLLLLGALCEADPAPGTPEMPPLLADSPNNSLCLSGYCFKRAGGDNGPCTPARVCSNSTIGGRGAGGFCSSDSDCPGGSCLNPCGPATNPPDYFCCRNIPSQFNEGGLCSRDQDCCGAFLAAARGCGSNGRCRILAQEDEPCVTTADCVRFGNSGTLECLAGLCTPPGEPPGRNEGDACEPTATAVNGYCRGDLTCFNCEQSGLGHICANASAPCCNDGGYDSECLPVLIPSETPTELYGLCCNNTCVSPSAVTTCGSCDNDCSGNQGNACADPSSGTCVWSGSDFDCQWQEDDTICPDPNPNDSYATRCWPTGTDTYRCDEYVPISTPQEWESWCFSAPASGRECSTDAHCSDCSESCTCDRPSVLLQLFGRSGRCECP